MFGVILILIGIFLLLSGLGLFAGAISKIFWPIVLIVAGILLIVKPSCCRGKKHGNCCGHSDLEDKKTDKEDK